MTAGDLLAGKPVELADGRALVRVRRVRTRNGVRLEIAAPAAGRAIRLCPLELETLTWQTHRALAELRRAADVPGDLPGALPGGEPVELANEYAMVQVRTVRARGEQRLEILAGRVGRGIRLCPGELEALARQTHETFSGFLRTPFGPEDETER